MAQVLRAAKPDDFKSWENLVEQAAEGDVYYLPGYVRPHQILEQTEAVALRLSCGGQDFLVPLLLRSFSRASGERVSDGFTAYGYGGILLTSGGKEVTGEQIGRVVYEIREWCRSQELAACVLRLHPLSSWQSEKIAPAIAADDLIIEERGETRAIDLSRWDADHSRIAGLPSGRASDLKAAQRNLKVIWDANRREQIAIFAEQYDQAMRRMATHRFYLFPAEYFERLAEELGERLAVAIAMHNEEPVGGVIFLRGKRWAHYHLAWVNDAGRRFKASTMLMNAGAGWAREHGCSLLHLGGGFAKDDGLLAFKRSFGNLSFRYSTATIVANRERYRELCADPKSPWPYSTGKTA